MSTGKASNRSKRSSNELGRLAEDIGAEWLKTQGHEILDQNWRTRRCEIDIVSSVANQLYFVEVKYRHGGNSIEAVDTAKLQKMIFSAETYMSMAGINVRTQPRLAVLALHQNPPQVLTFIDDILV